MSIALFIYEVDKRIKSACFLVIADIVVLALNAEGAEAISGQGRGREAVSCECPRP